MLLHQITSAKKTIFKREFFEGIEARTASEKGLGREKEAVLQCNIREVVSIFFSVYAQSVNQSLAVYMSANINYSYLSAFASILKNVNIV